MDNERLAKILSDEHVPDININARKRAVNMAVAEFQKQKQKNSQGVSILRRLMGISKTKQGVGTMEQRQRNKFIYGGMATAMAVVLVGGLSFTQLDDVVRRHTPSNTVAVQTPAKLQGVEFKTNETASQEVSQTAPPKPEAQDTDGEAQAVQGRVAEPEIVDPVQKWRRDDAPVQHVLPDHRIKKEDLGTRQEGDGVKQWRREQPESKESMVDEQVSPAYAEAIEQQSQPDLERAITEGSSSIPAPIKTYDSLKNNQTAGQAAPAEMMMEERAQSKEKAYNVPSSSIVADHYEPMPPQYQDQGRDKFEHAAINAFKVVAAEPVSTFSSDVDTASYSFIRRQLNNGIMPNPDAVRIEEMINYFDYSYPLPESRAEPFAPTVMIMDSPWAEGKKVMHIGIKGYELQKAELRSNIVFLLDVSGSMNAPDKLPLVKNSMKMLLDSLHPDDTVSIVVYAGHTGVVLEPTAVSKRSTILNAMNSLRAGGGTAGAAGIELAYNMAEQNFDEGAVNRVILATDGDFNVGISSHEQLKDYVAKKRDKGVFLSVLGFGQGNYNDQMMQALAQNGNGIAAYIDNLSEARKVLVQEATSSLFPIAKDVKFQVEFNPSKVAEYRLIGYETRALNREDFNNDKVDAGDIGAGHTVTAIYEFVPVGSEAVSVDPLRYTAKSKPQAEDVTDNGEYAFLKIRYKLPMENTSKLMTRPVTYRDDITHCPARAKCNRPSPSKDVQFSLAVAGFGQILKGGSYTGNFSFDDAITLANQGRGHDSYGYRAEFINMVRLAKSHSR